MFCGFGAVVLLVLILNTDTVRARNEVFADLRSEVVRLEQEVIVGREQLVSARNSLDAADNELVTTRGERDNVDAGYGSGCNAYLTKPIDRAELLATVRALLSQPDGATAGERA